jgi:hypothetical protein
MEVNTRNRTKVTWSIDANLVKRVKFRTVEDETDASTVVEKALKSI